MYKYIRNSLSKAQFDEKLSKNITESLKKNRIFSEISNFSSEKELAKLVSELKKETTNTLVIIGDDDDFNLLIGQVGKLENEIAIGYLPLVKSRIAKKLKINTWQSAVEALAQRRIKEKTIYSISSRYFYDEIYLNFDNDSSKDKLFVRADKNLELKLPYCQIKFENLNEDRFFSKTPVQIIAYREKAPQEPKKDSNVIKKLIDVVKNKHNKDSQELILSLHSKNFRIESETKAIDSINRKYSLSFGIGKSSKTIRLITKRPEIKNS